MDKRVVLAVALSIAILLVWWRIFPPAGPAPGHAPRQSGSASSPESSIPPAAGGSTTGAAAGGASGTLQGGPSRASRAPEVLAEIMSPAVKFVFSNWGGGLREAQLREGKYLLRKDDGATGVQLVPTSDPEQAELLTAFPDSGFVIPPDAVWQIQRPAADTVIFHLETDAVAVEKRFQLDSTRYRLQLDVSVHNKTDHPQEHHLALRLFGLQNPNEVGGGFFSAASANRAEVLCYVGDKARRATIESLGKHPIEEIGGVRWMAVDDKFFVIAAVPYPENPAQDRKCLGRALSTNVGEGILTFAGRTLSPGGTTGYKVAVFAGPKAVSELDQVNPGGEDAHLGAAVDVTFAVLSRPLLWLLKLFHGFTGNWGLAIILLTVAVKLLTLYPTQKALLSGRRMQRLAPKLAAVRKKYENDRQRQGVETMNLYKAHGVSPFGGCLPSLIQMPIWIALYSTLSYSVELYRASFVGYIHDLTAKDPYYITPLLMGGVMFLQMRMSPAGPDPQQQKMMSVMMPVMFTAFSLVLPSGLALYMLTSYLIGILQQLWVNSLDRKLHGPMPRAEALPAGAQRSN